MDDDRQRGHLGHTYGAATDVPDLLRELASRLREERAGAMRELYGKIWHQGTVCAATGIAVPSLVELLRESAVRGKVEIHGLLEASSGGSSYFEVH
jgi:hypothetical protein